MKALRAASEPATREILRHWQEAVPNDRLAHLVKHAAAKKQAYENILWALVNTKEFLFVW